MKQVAAADWRGRACPGEPRPEAEIESLSRNVSSKSVAREVPPCGRILGYSSLAPTEALAKDERLVMQFEYTNSMFGQNYPKIPLPKDATFLFREFVDSHPCMLHGLVDQ